MGVLKQCKGVLNISLDLIRDVRFSHTVTSTVFKHTNGTGLFKSRFGTRSNNQVSVWSRTALTTFGSTANNMSTPRSQDPKGNETIMATLSNTESP